MDDGLDNASSLAGAHTGSSNEDLTHFYFP